MKVQFDKQDRDTTDPISTRPRIGNLNGPAEKPLAKKPSSADIRLRIGAAAIAILILFTGIHGSIVKSSLSGQLAEQQRILADVQAQALRLGITQDEDGEPDLPAIMPGTSVDITDIDWDSLEQRNSELLDSFTSLLLNWEGEQEYERVRQKLTDDWKFTEDSRLLSVFMPPAGDNNLDNGIKLSGYTTFVLSNNGKDMSYFLICTVYSSSSLKKSAIGTVGIGITINSDGTISNVTAQTLS